MPACSSRAAHWSSRVDFPMPGSPPTSTTDPGTMPPPSTKSNSASPVRQRSGRTVARLESWTGATSPALAFQPSDLATDRPTASSTSVFHSPHASQRPAHFGWSAPHSVQRNTERALATVRLGRCVPQGAVVEPGEFALEVQRHEAGGAVALLTDEQLRQTLDVVPVFVGRAVIHLGAVDEAHHVRVLLDRARLAQVGELRAVVAGALVRRPRQLRQRDDRDVELLRQRLEGARDVGDLLLAALGVGGALHELEVVHDHHADVVLGLEAARLGAHGEGGERGGVVDPDGSRPEQPGRAGELRIVVVAQLATPQDRKSTRLNSSHLVISYAVFCLK